MRCKLFPFSFCISFSHSTKCVSACYLLFTICRSPPFIVRVQRHTQSDTRGQSQSAVEKKKQERNPMSAAANKCHQSLFPYLFLSASSVTFRLHYYYNIYIRNTYHSTRTVFIYIKLQNFLCSSSSSVFCVYYVYFSMQFVRSFICLFNSICANSTIGSRGAVASCTHFPRLLAAIMRMTCRIIYGEHFNNGN